ncbi:MAG: DUF1573 domain-containing protein [Planctomycetaceae bacterium]|jgi:hypothetical protein|nr:DUF1573 domain-containing protein [Planctomycetaceae bacterium]
MSEQIFEKPYVQKKRLGQLFRFIFRPLLIAIVVLVIGGIGCYYVYGSLSAGWARLNGYILYVENDTLDFGTISADQTRTGVFRLRNLSQQPVIILGAEADCSCVQSADLPLTVSPGTVIDFPVTFYSSQKDEGSLVRRQLLLNLNVDQPITMLVVRAKVVSN